MSAPGYAPIYTTPGGRPGVARPAGTRPPTPMDATYNWRVFAGVFLVLIFLGVAAVIIVTSIDLSETEEIEDSTPKANLYCSDGNPCHTAQSHHGICQPTAQQPNGFRCAPGVCYKANVTTTVISSAGTGSCSAGVCTPVSPAAVVTGTCAGNCNVTANCPALSIFATDGTTSIVTTTTCSVNGNCVYTLNPAIVAIAPTQTGYPGPATDAYCLAFATGTPYASCLQADSYQNGTTVTCTLQFACIGPHFPG